MADVIDQPVRVALQNRAGPPARGTSRPDKSSCRVNLPYGTALAIQKVHGQLLGARAFEASV